MLELAAQVYIIALSLHSDGVAVLQRRFWYYAAVWLGVAFVIGVIQGATLLKAHRIEANVASTQGYVTEVRPEHHRSIQYAFAVNGRTYSGTALAGDDIYAMSVGRPLTIYYDQTDPTSSMIDNPAGGTRATTKDLVILLALFPTLVALAFIVVDTLRLQRTDVRGRLERPR